MVLDFFKEVYDPIHGFIKLTKLEVKTIDHLIFQRLHNINQLGTAYLVFPSSKSSRFSHSLGVLAVVTKMIDNFKYLSKKGDSTRKYDLDVDLQKQIRLAALLHDIGHLPFSHCTEKVIGDYLIKNYPDKKIPSRNPSFHEWLSGEIIKKTRIYNPLETHEDVIVNDRENISQIIQGSSKFMLLNQMLNSKLDADRLDYLIRDSHSTGVSFGQIDLNQILRKMFIRKIPYKDNKKEEHAIIYSMKAIPSIDNYYFARMFMYRTVYYHKVINYYDFLIGETYKTMINSENLGSIEKYLPLKPDFILKHILEDNKLTSKEMEKNLDDFYNKWHRFDDLYLWECMRNCWNKLKLLPKENFNNETFYLFKLLSLLMQRRKSNLIWELDRLASNEKKYKDISDDILGDLLLDLEKWINDEFKIDHINEKMPLFVINIDIPTPLYGIDRPDPESWEEYEGNYILFHNKNKDSEFQYSYLRNVPSSINYQKRKSKFHIFRVFYAGEDVDQKYSNMISTKFSEMCEEFNDKKS